MARQTLTPRKESTPPNGEPRETRNTDVASFCRKLKFYVIEFAKCVSTDLEGIRSADRDRMDQMIDDLGNYVDWIIAQPEIDAPKTSPRTIEILGFDRNEFPLVNNEVCNQLIDALYTCWVECATGQSSSLPNGLYSHDVTRIRQQLERCRNLLTNYSDKTQPLDLPESNPAFASSGHGRHGPS